MSDTSKSKPWPADSMQRSLETHVDCALVASVIMSVIWYFRIPDLFGTSLLFIVIFLALRIMAYGIRRRSRFEPMAPWLYLLTNVAATAVICVNHEHYIRTNWIFQPFIGIKIISIFLPLICPPVLWVGFTSIALFTVVPIVQYYSWPQEAQALLGIQEPWITALVAISAGIIYSQRLQAEQLQKEKTAAESRVHVMERVAHILIGAQHLLNTPLQTIESTMKVLELKYPLESALVLGIRRSLDVSRQVSQSLRFAESYVQWSSLALPHSPEELDCEIRNVIGLSDSHINLRADSHCGTSRP